MPIVLKTRREIEKMRRAGQLAFEVLAMMKQATRPGITTLELDTLAETEMSKHGAVGLSKNYPTYKPGEGFPGSTCISINDEVVHGIPGPRVIQEGDIVTLDLALGMDGYCADTAITVTVGSVPPRTQKLLDVTHQTLELAIANIKPGRRWSDIARLMQHYVEQAGFSVVREFVGHGIGRSMHEDPKVPNFVTSQQMRGDFKLEVGMTLAVEPMVIQGRHRVEMRPDGWTVVSHDRSPSAHFEHTVAVTADGADVLTNGQGAASQD